MSAWNPPPPTYDVPSSYESTLTPYLQLSHLLSLTWLAYPILSLIFVAFRLQLSLASAQDDIASAKSNLLASCQAAEKAATSAASMPRYMAIASNDQFVDVVNGSLNAARATLVLALTAMEGIINFIIDLYRSTFLCFLELVVRGALEILIGAVNELNDLVHNAANGLRDSIQSDISSANSVIQSAIDAINKVNPFGNIQAPSIPVPNLDALANVTLPDSFTQALTNLNNSIPTVAQIKNEIESIVDQPFELLKKDINDTFSAITFNASVLPVPQVNTLSFCNDMDLSVVDDVGHDIIQTAKIGTVILIVLALVLVGLNCLLEWYKWRCMKRHLEYTRQAWTSDPTMVHAQVASAPVVTLTDHNLMMLNVSSAHPLLARIANNISKLLRLSPLQHTHLQWFFNYIFHPPALACLLIGLIGLLSIQIQLAAMGPLIAKYQQRSTDATANFSNTIFTAINGSMYNQSATYANEVNARVDTIQTTINDGVFGWVNTTTVTLNTTINNFYNDVQKVVNTVFGGTILETPANDFIQCFIGSKVDAIENALTFLHDNLVIDMPRMNDSALVLSQASINEATQPIAAAALGSGDDAGDNEGLILKLVHSYAESLEKERVMFGIFLGIWGFVVLMALCIIFWNSYGKRLVAMRKRRRFEREQRLGFNGLVPFSMSPTPGEKGAGYPPNASHLDLPSFTPLPSPKGSTFWSFNSSRNTSPSPAASRTNLASSGHSEVEQGRSGTSWGEAFRQNFVAPPVNRLKAIGKKSMGKDVFSKNSASSSEIDGKDSNGKKTAWLGRVAAMLDKKKSIATVETRPKLHISISPPESDNGASTARVLSSRWSSSPVEPSSTWRNLIKKSPPTPTIALPARPSPKDTPNDIETPEVPVSSSTAFATPIHAGFEDSRYPKLRKPPPVPPSNVSFTFPINAPKPPSPDSFRATQAVPSTPPDNTPITRLLTSINAHQSSSADPFVTPFDDEYQVTIAQPANTRKSIPTNPFLDSQVGA
ncbi:Plasma membrane fusion protein PRM1 [Termitomyces sp. T112]|nr:Plasma membrane fusion protein PRM1 [Termitomyces sp. T112]KAH0589542.1 hypothetical protein H2248_005278 [Termitomyces sp. 'cryptogamus']